MIRQAIARLAPTGRSVAAATTVFRASPHPLRTFGAIHEGEKWTEGPFRSDAEKLVAQVRHTLRANCLRPRTAAHSPQLSPVAEGKPHSSSLSLSLSLSLYTYICIYMYIYTVSGSWRNGAPILKDRGGTGPQSA